MGLRDEAKAEWNNKLPELLSEVLGITVQERGTQIEIEGLKFKVGPKGELLLMASGASDTDQAVTSKWDLGRLIQHRPPYVANRSY